MGESAKAATIVLHVRRDSGAAERWSRYELPGEEPTTVFAALRAIYESHDGSLAFRNYTCWKGLCRACEVKVDGRAVKGCLTVVEPGREYRVEPRDGVPVQRDLFVPGRRSEEAPA